MTCEVASGNYRISCIICLYSLFLTARAPLGTGRFWRTYGGTFVWVPCEGVARSPLPTTAVCLVGFDMSQ